MKKEKTSEKYYKSTTQNKSIKNWNIAPDKSLTIINNGNINLNNQNFTGPYQHPDHSVDLSSDDESDSAYVPLQKKTKFLDVPRELKNFLSQQQVQECTEQKLFIARLYLWMAVIFQLFETFLMQGKLAQIFQILSILGMLFVLASHLLKKIKLVYLIVIFIHVNFVLILIFHGLPIIKMETQDNWSAKQTTYLLVLQIQQVMLNQLFAKKVSVPFSVLFLLAFGVSQRNEGTWGQTCIQCILWTMIVFGSEMGWLCDAHKVLDLVRYQQYLIEDMKKKYVPKQQQEKTTDVAERRLMTIINATFSHDMRNPINSIYSQNVLQNQLNQQMNQLLTSDKSKNFIKKLKMIHEQQCESISIQSSCTQILQNMVNDLIDFGQIKSDNFSLDCFNSDIMESTEEVVNILKLKAQLSKIKVSVDYKGFPLVKLNDDCVIQKNEIDYIVNIDERRFKQILMNLLSNALKFSSPHGVIEISCNYIGEAKQLGSPKLAKLFRRPGMIEVSVKDRGIGIKEEDQEKLFKMFEFIDTKKELTTQGVGLGLHISKLIAEKHGGDIECQSVWQQGTVMTFVIACQERRIGDKEIKRIKNPVGIRYPKFVLNVQQFESPEVERKETNFALESLINSINIQELNSNSHINISFPLLKNSSIDSNPIDIKKFDSKNIVIGSSQEFCGQISSIKQIDCIQQHNKDEMSNSSIRITVNSKSSSSLEILEENERRGDIRVWDMPPSHMVTDSHHQRRRSRSMTLPVPSEKKQMTMKVESFAKNYVSMSEFCPEKDKRILIVDDEFYNIMGLKVLMTQASNMGILGYIDQASSGQEAVRLISNSLTPGQTQYGLIFMDLSMPVMNGFETTDQIRKLIKQSGFQQPKIIACTGHTEQEFIIKAWHHRIDEFVMKPTKIEVLESILKETIEFNHIQ